MGQSQQKKLRIIFNYFRISMSEELANIESAPEVQDSSQSESGDSHELDTVQIAKLYESYNLMKQFCDDISSQNTALSTQILQKYAEKSIKMSLLPKNVLHVLEKRIQRMLKNKKLKKNWSHTDTQILYWTYCQYCSANSIQSVEQTTLSDWQNVSRLIPGSSGDSCMFKILSLKKTKLAQQKWNKYESSLLLEIGMKYEKKNWRIISQELYKRNTAASKIFRNAKQCKEHWVCYLNPELRKGSWTLEQDMRLLSLIIMKQGGRKWAEIAKKFGGRTENALKNRYTLIIERLRRQNNSNDDLALTQEYLLNLERRSQSSIGRKNQSQQQKYINNTIRQAQESQSQNQGPNQHEGDHKQPERANLSEDKTLGSTTNFIYPYPGSFQVTGSPLPDMNSSFETTGMTCVSFFFNPSQYLWIMPTSATMNQ